MADFFGITGTPGTGKKTLAPIVASKLGLPCISLYDQAVSSGLVRQDDNDAEVDTAALGRFIMKHASRPALVYGHLLPYALGARELRRVVVLRCEPKTLKRRLLARGYLPTKAMENVEAELIGVLSADSITAFGSRKIAEFDTTESKPDEAVRVISEFLEGGRELGPNIDWTLSYTSASKLRSLLSVRPSSQQVSPRN